jgi:hypothetical protein
MRQPDYPDYLYVVPLSVGCAVVCEQCQRTVAVTFTPNDTQAIIANHTCTTTSTRTSSVEPEVER